MSLVPVSLDDYEEYKLANPIPDFVIKGLPKGYLGLLIAPPDTGKSHLCLSIAYELSSGLNILGVRPDVERPIKTLYWPAEDGVHQAFKRISDHLNVLPKDVHHQIRDNVSIYQSSGPILSASRGVSQSEAINARRELDKLIEHAKEFDLVIIDTIREAIGTATEVEDDVRIKEVLKEIAQSANVAVLITHHPTKNVIRGLESVSTASGSGLSCTVAFARCHFYLETVKDKKNGSVRHSLLQPKANFLAHQDRINQPLTWGEGSLLRATWADLEHHHQEVSGVLTGASDANILEPQMIAEVQVTKQAAPPRKQPKVIEATDEALSEESRSLAASERRKNSPVSEELVKRFLETKRLSKDR